ncbi:hypothetical protein [uncultured Ferrimonas sp.]|uniref:hypothetical protein n=1 Tax=uncultured Ferrimonas sp. TaxID=432640 RepID=UPI00260DC060|nr:hypothetical protein [uncultured Ferrimonas sp.]
MATKYSNPPVIYTVAKLIYADSIGSYSDEKYKKLLASLTSVGFDSYSLSKVMGIQFKQSDNQFSATPANAERVGYFSPNRKRCALIDENTIELRLSEYDNHTRFLDEFKVLLDTCQKNEVALGNKLREVELHYVDLFVPEDCKLNDMFSSVSLPVGQFYSAGDDAIKIGATNFTRILAKGTEKVSVSLEQVFSSDPKRRKYLPDSLVEPDEKLGMPLDVSRLFKSQGQVEYAIVHTACGALLESSKLNTEEIREKLEHLYRESRKTFDHMIEPNICGHVWQELDIKVEVE